LQTKVRKKKMCVAVNTSNSASVITKLKQTPWPLVRVRTIPTERPPLVGEVSANFAAIGCHVVGVTDPYGRILGFLDRSRYFLFQVAPRLYSWGWVDPSPDPLLLRKSGSAGNRTRDLWICSQELWPLDHTGCPNCNIVESTFKYSNLPTDLQRSSLCKPALCETWNPEPNPCR
jgi:hypothetical protein